MSEQVFSKSGSILKAFTDADNWRRWGNLLEVCAEVENSPIPGTSQELNARMKFAQTEEAYALRTARAHQADIPVDSSI